MSSKNNHQQYQLVKFSFIVFMVIIHKIDTCPDLWNYRSQLRAVYLYLF
jgi:hypothetical protein